MTNLRELATKATPGPWVWDDDCVSENYDANERAPWLTTGNGDTAVIKGEVRIPKPSDAAYIAAASPDAVIGLLDRIDRLEARCAELESRVESINDDRNYIQGQLRESKVKCAEFERDAGRYQWLTDDHPELETRKQLIDIAGRLWCMGKGAADAAIDAAIAASVPKGE